MRLEYPCGNGLKYVLLEWFEGYVALWYKIRCSPIAVHCHAVGRRLSLSVGDVMMLVEVHESKRGEARSMHSFN